MKNNLPSKNYCVMNYTAVIFAVILLISVSDSMYAQKKEKLLGEKQFDIELTQQGKKKASEPAKDQLVFRADKLSSSFMLREFVFTPSNYTASVDSTSGAPIITFVSDSKNADGDKLKWTGTVTGEAMDGTAVIVDKKGKAKADYTFTGKQKKFRGK